MYHKYFGFREPPFNLTPDPKFFFSSSLHREALAALFYGIKSKKGFIVVTGEVGTGKTTLLRKLLRSLEATHHSVFIFNPLLSFDDLLEYALRDLGVEPNDRGRATLIQQLNEFLLEKQKAGHIVSLLIDECQQLSESTLEAIRLLSNLETDREKLLQIILVGQPELEAKLNSPSLRQLKQRVSLWGRLDRLTPKDTEAYIRHRLELAGYQGPEIFDSAAVKLIAEKASGTPRLINAICDNALLTAFAVSTKVVSESIVREVVRDLRLHPETISAEHSGERQVAGRVVPNISRSASEGRDGKLASGGQRGEEHDSWVRAGRGASLAADGKREYADVVEMRRFAKSVAAVSEFKPRRNPDRGRVLATAEEPAWVEVSQSPEPGAEQKSLSDRGSAHVSQAFFSKMAQSLTDAMGPMASLVLRDRIARLGESATEFPIVRLPELVAAIKQEILSEPLKRRFEQDVATQVQEHSKVAVWRSSTD
jgi:general secretion pathway protein A